MPLNSEGNGLGFGWASLFGQFPGSNQAHLATVTFDIPELQAYRFHHVYVSKKYLIRRWYSRPVKLSYLVDDPTLTGMGFTLDFDSSVLSLDSDQMLSLVQLPLAGLMVKVMV